jgi:hypothetical protein
MVRAAEISAMPRFWTVCKTCVADFILIWIATAGSFNTKARASLATSHRLTRR